MSHSGRPRELKAPRKTAVALAPVNARFPALIGMRANMAAVFGGLEVTIVGCGSVGERIAVHLARSGVAGLCLVDPKRVKPESILTHDCVPGVIGQNKAVRTGRLCLTIQPALRVRVCTSAIQDTPLAALAETGIVVLATDNLPAEVETGRRCMMLGKALANGALYGNTLTAVVRFFGNVDADGPCPACLYGPREWREHDTTTPHYSCDGSSHDTAKSELSVQPTRSLSHLCALTADLTVNQIIRHTLGLGQPVADTMIEYNGYTHGTLTVPLRRNPTCRCDHARYAVAHARRPLRHSVLGDLCRDAGVGAIAPDVVISLPGMEWIERAFCVCGATVSVRRFAVRGHSSVGRCRVCHNTLTRHPLHVQSTPPAESLGAALNQPLGRLGGGEAPYVVFRDTTRAWLVLPPRHHSQEP